MRSHVLPYLLCLGALSACSGNVNVETTTGAGGTATTTGAGATGSGATGSGATGAGGSSTTSTSDTGPDQCSPTPMAGGCIVPQGGFVGSGPVTLQVTGTVTEIGEGAPPLDCDGYMGTVSYLASNPVWARLEDDMMQEWVVAFEIPALAIGFNGHITAGDTVEVSFTSAEKEDCFGPILISELAIHRDDVLVAYVSDGMAPPWYSPQQDAACYYEEGCCGVTRHDATASPNGTAVTVPHQQTVEIDGLAISNIELDDYIDLGCCNYCTDGLSVSVAALPAP